VRTLPATRENSLRSKAYLARTHWNGGGWAGAGWGEEADLAVDEWEDGVGVGRECRWGGEEERRRGELIYSQPGLARRFPIGFTALIHTVIDVAG